MSSNPEGSKASAKARAGNSTSPGFLEKIDRYGYIPQLMYGGDTACKSQFGGFLTFGEGLCYVFLVCFTVYRYFERKSPSTSLNRVFHYKPTGFVLDKSTLPFAIGIEDPTYQHFVDETIYTLEAYYTQTIKSVQNGALVSDYRKHNLKIIPCSQAGLDQELFGNLDLGKLFCLENFVTDEMRINLTGRFESDFFGALGFDFKQCKGTHCKPQAEIDKMLKDSYFAIYYLDRVTKLSNFDKPTSHYQNSIFVSTSPQYTKYLHLFVANNVIKTDSSLIGYSEQAQLEFVSIGQWRTDFSSMSESSVDRPAVFFTLSMRMDSIENVFNRKYKNLYDYLAEFGGMSNVILVLTFILSFKFGINNMYKDFAKKTVEHAKFLKILTDNQFSLPDNSSGEKKSKIHPTSISQHHEIRNLFSKLIQGHYHPPKPKVHDFTDQAPQQKSDRLADNTSSKNMPAMVKKIPSSTRDESLANLNKPEESSRNNQPVADLELWRPRMKKLPRVVAALKPPKPPNPKTRELLQSAAALQNISAAQLYAHSYFPFCLKKQTRNTLDSLISSVTAHVAKHLDAVEIIRAVDELHKLKEFLFSPDQLVLFDLLPRTKLHYNEKEKRFNMTVGDTATDPPPTATQEELEGMRASIKQSIHNIASKPERSEIDNKLIGSFKFLVEENSEKDTISEQQPAQL